MGDEKRTRRQFSSEDKAEAVKRHLVGGEAVSAICEDLGIAPNLFYRWQKELFDQGARVFEPRTDRGQDKRPQEQIATLEARLKKKDEVIAELMEEHLALKKSLGET